MRTEQLQQAITVAQCGSITDAAKKLYMQHATLSHSMQMLEKELGADLFVRTKSGITLTAYGEKFLPLAEEMVAREALMHTLSQETPAVPKQYTIEACPILSDILAEQYLQPLMESFPDTEFQLLETYPPGLIPHLTKQMTDVVFSVYCTKEYAFFAHQLEREQIHQCALRTTYNVVVCHKTNPLVQQNNLQKKDLSGSRIYLPRFLMANEKLASSRNNENMSLFQDHVLFSNYHNLLKALLQNPDAVTLLPDCLLPLVLLPEARKELSVLPLQEPPLIQYVAYTNKENPITQELLRLVTDTFSEDYSRAL